MIRSALAALLLAAAAPLALADVPTERFVEQQANQALAALKDPAKSATIKRAEFRRLMDEFADINRIARFSVGKYARRFSDAELAAYTDAFEDYSLAVYELYMAQFADAPIEVTGSQSVGSRDGDMVVETLVSRIDGSASDVRWRVLKTDEAPGYQVLDIGLNIDGNLLWLGIEQRAQFVAFLDRNNGSAAELTSLVERMTADLKRDMATGTIPEGMQVASGSAG